MRYEMKSKKKYERRTKREEIQSMGKSGGDPSSKDHGTDRCGNASGGCNDYSCRLENGCRNGGISRCGIFATSVKGLPELKTENETGKEGE